MAYILHQAGHHCADINSGYNARRVCILPVCDFLKMTKNRQDDFGGKFKESGFLDPMDPVLLLSFETDAVNDWSWYD